MSERRRMRGIKAEYAQAGRLMSADSLHLSAVSLGQNCPPCCPQGCPPSDEQESPSFSDPLGVPLSIRQAAALIGVSAWTIRQRYLAAGLPHFRSTPQGKLIFYKNQIINWLLTEQRKGGVRP
jgi:hypothetical protein